MKFDPTWEVLRSFGNSKVSKLTILIPIFGYLIIFNDSFVFLISSSLNWVCAYFQDGTCNASENVAFSRDFMLQKVVDIYLALSVIAFSTILFQLFCPYEIKRFWHVETYVAENTRIFHHEFNRRLRNILDIERQGEIDRIQSTFDRYKEHDRSKASEMYDRDILSLWFDFQNSRFPTIRWICFVMFAFGVALIMYPTFVVFGKIVYQSL